METLIEVDSSTKSWNLASGATPVTLRRATLPPSPNQSRYGGASTTPYSNVQNRRMKPDKYFNGSAINQKSSSKTAHEDAQHEEVPSMARNFYILNKGKSKFGTSGEVVNNSVETSPEEKAVMVETTPRINHPSSEFESSFSSCSLESTVSDPSGGEGDIGQLKNHVSSQSVQTYCPSPSNSVYTNTGTLYVEAKESFTHTEVSEEASAVEKYGKIGVLRNSCDVGSQKTSAYRRSTDSDVSNESSSSSLSSAWYKPHKANDKRWEAIQAIRSREGAIEFKHFNPLTKLGCGDIGTVYLSELVGTETYFAMKFMNKEVLSARKKLLRAQTEREILQSLDHPFLPTLYTHFETQKVSCLVMEFCPGGDLHNLRQKQPGKYFPEHAARFYVAEVLLALEYLHMLGIIYRDLKPENVLVREDGHIMLSDFDLSLRCAVCPTLVKSSKLALESKNSSQSACIEPTCLMQPDCTQPACFGPRFLGRKAKKDKKMMLKNEMNNPATPLPELLAEPTSARSMSFVGTHEYLAPEIVKGEGHGSAVDWWTFGIFLYELLFGKTPFKGAGNRATLFNVVGQPLRFPESPPVSFAARDLIRGLLVKEPEHRLAYRRGATEIKQHPFFQSVNWALIRCTNPPQVPRLRQSMAEFLGGADLQKVPPAGGGAQGVDVKPAGNYYDIEFF